MSKYELNKFYTTHLVLNVMDSVARQLNVDIHDDTVSDTLYDICCNLEGYPEDADFGSSDHYSYITRARQVLIKAPAEKAIAELINKGEQTQAEELAAVHGLSTTQIAEEYNIDAYR